MPNEQPKSERLTEEQKARDLGYLRKVLIEEERRNSQVIPLPEEAVPLPPPVAASLPPPVSAPIPVAIRRTHRNTVFLNVIVGCIVIPVFFLINFFVWGEVPSPSDFKLAAAALLVLWFLASLDARERRQEEHFETIERELAEIKRKLR